MQWPSKVWLQVPVAVGVALSLEAGCCASIQQSHTVAPAPSWQLATAKAPVGGVLVTYPGVLKTLPATDEAWLRLEHVDPASSTRIDLKFLRQCPPVDQRARPCADTAQCVRLAGKESFSDMGSYCEAAGSATYWWPGNPAICARIDYVLLSNSPSHRDLSRLVDYFPKHVTLKRTTGP
jgi:hypothetical protein